MIRVMCDTCGPMVVHLDTHAMWFDAHVVAAECKCGRAMGHVVGIAIARGAGTVNRNDIDTSVDLEQEAKASQDRARKHANDMDQVIAAARWAKAK